MAESAEDSLAVLSHDDEKLMELAHREGDEVFLKNPIFIRQQLLLKLERKWKKLLQKKLNMLQVEK